MSSAWCTICRGDDDLELKCAGCARRFHKQCLGLPVFEPVSEGWLCEGCAHPPQLSHEEHERREAFRATQKTLLAHHRTLAARRNATLLAKEELLAPFVPPAKLQHLRRAVLGKGKEGEPAGRKARKAPNSDAKEAKAAADAELLARRVRDTQPSYVTATLRDYQVSGVNWMLDLLDSGVGGILGDEMGLGKTLQTLTFLAFLKKVRGLTGPSLVVAPLAVYQNWANECKRFTPDLTFFKLHGSGHERSVLLERSDVVYAEYDVFVTTYETFKSAEVFFTEDIGMWNVLIVDEAHNLKNEASKLHVALSRVRANFRLLLTGTPLQNNLHELWALLRFLVPSVFTNSEQFDASFEEGSKRMIDAELIGKARDLLQPFMLRRLKSDVVKLPPKYEADVECPMSALQSRWYARLLDRDLESQSLLSASQLQMLITQLRKVCNHPRILMAGSSRARSASGLAGASAGGAPRADDVAAQSVVEIPFVDFENTDYEEGSISEEERTRRIKEAQDELRGLSGASLVAASGKLAVLDALLQRLSEFGSRVLIFSSFTQTLDMLQEYLEWRGLGRFLRMDGSTNRIQRELDLREFNKPNSEYFAYLISTRAGGVGINLATADAVILFEPDWNPQIDLQATDRAHRLGQTKPVRVFRLMCGATVEHRILRRARQKVALGQAVNRDGEISNGKFEGDELQQETDGSNDEKLAKSELLQMLLDSANDKEARRSHVAPGVELGFSDAQILAVIERAAKDSKLPIDPNAPPLPSYTTPTVTEAQLSPSMDVSSETCPAENVSGQAPTGPASPQHSGATSTETRATMAPDVSATEDRIVAGSQPTSGDEEDAQSSSKADEQGMGEDGIDGAPRRRLSLAAQRPKRKREQAGRYEPQMNSNIRKKRAPLRHFDECFLCTEGGELLECGKCPCVYHLKCVGLKRVPKGIWACPWHSCIECARTVSTAGGMIFRCTDCPTAYCFDCWPQGLARVDPTPAFVDPLLRRGFDPTKNATLFVCGECADEKENKKREAEKLERKREKARLERERLRREAIERQRQREDERAAKERERAAKEAERAAKEAERAAKEAQRVAREKERAAKQTISDWQVTQGIEAEIRSRMELEMARKEEARREAAAAEAKRKEEEAASRARARAAAQKRLADLELQHHAELNCLRQEQAADAVKLQAKVREMQQEQIHKHIEAFNSMCERHWKAMRVLQVALAGDLGHEDAGSAAATPTRAGFKEVATGTSAGPVAITGPTAHAAPSCASAAGDGSQPTFSQRTSMGPPMSSLANEQAIVGNMIQLLGAQGMMPGQCPSAAQPLQMTAQSRIAGALSRTPHRIATSPFHARHVGEQLIPFASSHQLQHPSWQRWQTLPPMTWPSQCAPLAQVHSQRQIWQQPSWMPHEQAATGHIATPTLAGVQCPTQSTPQAQPCRVATALPPAASSQADAQPQIEKTQRPELAPASSVREPSQSTIEKQAVSSKQSKPMQATIAGPKVQQATGGEVPQANPATNSTAVAAETPPCGQCGKDLVDLNVCGRCRRVAYCNAQCQHAHWPIHARQCKSMSSH